MVKGKKKENIEVSPEKKKTVEQVKADLAKLYKKPVLFSAAGFGIKRLTSGLMSVDNLFCGGIPKGRVTVLAGGPDIVSLTSCLGWSILESGAVTCGRPCARCSWNCPHALRRVPCWNCRHGVREVAMPCASCSLHRTLLPPGVGMHCPATRSSTVSFRRRAASLPTALIRLSLFTRTWPSRPMLFMNLT